MLFLTLNTFSTTGGLEKVCRTASKVFDELATEDKKKFRLFSMHDSDDVNTEPYIRREAVKTFNGRRTRFVLSSIFKGFSEDVVILSHIQLASAGLWIKRCSPRTKIILLAHGIEVLKPVSPVQKEFLKRCDLIVAVSEYTRAGLNTLCPNKNIEVINNCIDPFLAAPATARDAVREKIGFQPDDFIIVTVSRVGAGEVSKNYEKVLISMQNLKRQIPNLKYLIVGRYEQDEKRRIENEIARLALENDVVFTGYIPDGELSSYYNAGDLYVMPSKKEGFGITFIEAMYFGLPVIGGNRDGSVDALLNGRLGLLVDPERQDEITGAIAKIFVNHNSFKPDRQVVVDHFGFEVYKEKWRRVLRG